MIDASTRVDITRVFLSLKEKIGLSIIFVTRDYTENLLSSIPTLTKKCGEF